MAHPSQSTPRDKLPTVVQGMGEETAAGPQDNTVTKGDFIPTKLQHYKVLHKLGQGGMGWVLLAEDTQLSRRVALKVMRSRHAADQESRERFKSEAKAAAALNHDNIVTIYQVGEDRGIPFFAMELLEGGTLQQRLEYPKPLSIGASVRIARQIAEGLEAAHARGVIHRDIKPANIWLESPKGRVKILDFGLARQTDAKSGLTQAGEIVGTPHYMAPEQARGRAIDARTDLFSLGCILYRMTTGKLPFAGETLLATLTAIAVDTPTPVTELNASIPPALAELIDKLLAKDPVQRPASASALIEELVAIEAEHSAVSRSGFNIEVPPAIQIQISRPVRLPAETPPSVAATATSTPVQIKRTTSPVVSRPAVARPAPITRPSRFPWILTVSLIFALAPFLVLGIWWLFFSPPAAVNPAPRTSNPADLNLRRVESLETASLAASHAAAEWVLAHAGAGALVHVRVQGDPTAIKISALAELPREAYRVVGFELQGNRKLTDADLSRFANITTLSWLDLTNTNIGDAGLAQLTNLAGLTTVKLEGTEVTDKGIEKLVVRSPVINRLLLGRTKCTAQVLPHLARLKQLQELSLDSLPIANSDLHHLGDVSHLQELNLSGTKVTDQGLVELRSFPELERLRLDRTAITDAGLDTLAQAGRLTSLSMNGSTHISAAGLAHLARLSRLDSLEICDASELRDLALRELGKIKSLRLLVLTNGQFSLKARTQLEERLTQCTIKLVDPAGSATGK